jgi:hypothetical protein
MPGVIRKSRNGAVQLSPNFYLSEFVESDKAVRLGIDNTPDPMSVQNLFKVAALLEEVRKLLGGLPILVSSGYRCPRLNAEVGGSLASDHLRGAAADFRCPGFGTPLQIASAIAKSGIKFGQLIWEGTWVHISIPDGTNDGEVLTAKFVDGKAVYTKGLNP